ncbi:aldehyde dehydrogenase family protein [Dactylosporangium sp. NPDC005572]|uniref:aldehyde dehydrogenase family protein n=1 Tax=Dactylosporangium sp. NPDC005572 TaxID=3156889 RepID=UPI0033B86CCB
MSQLIDLDTIRNAYSLGGQWVRPRSELPPSVVTNSADGTPLAHVVQAGPDDVDAAIQMANESFTSFSQWPTAERAALLVSLADALDKRAPALAETIALEVGTPRRIAEAVQVGMPVRVLHAYAEAIAELDLDTEIGHSLVRRVPTGVVGAITPWNYPLHQVIAKVGAALAAGCPIVLKPSKEAPLSALALVDAAAEAGVPPGVLSVVPGPGVSVGEAIAAHPGIALLSFTGSTKAGVRVATLAARNVTRVALELGGKSASIILDGADLPAAVKGSVRNGMLNSGQTCSAWTRMLVPRARLAEVAELAQHELAKLTVGHPLQPSTRLGPLVSARQQQSVCEYIDHGLAEGLRIAAQGSVVESTGFYVAPTVFLDVPADSRLAQEEIFGPVLCIIGHDGADDAVAIANNSEYGLAGGVWAATEQQAMEVAVRLRTGQVDINGAAFNPAAPFGGFRRSGIGRELGRFGIEEFLETTAIQRP